MKFEIVFEAKGTGVWSLHDSRESCEKHILLLKNSTPHAAIWSIICDGIEIQSNKPKTLSTNPVRVKKDYLIVPVKYLGSN